MQNPFEIIASRLSNIEELLLDIKHGELNPAPAPPPLSDADRWEQGIQVAVDEMGLKPQTVYQQISKIPHRKLHGKLYFNRVQLRAYIEREGGKGAA
ncbi:hypothetical protein [Runella sp.]|uniref:hypothetical protein n=1 Tax=Runella sp. TaxID=1960881 RepID=UPI003018D8C6